MTMLNDVLKLLLLPKLFHSFFLKSAVCEVKVLWVLQP